MSKSSTSSIDKVLEVWQCGTILLYIENKSTCTPHDDECGNLLAR